MEYRALAQTISENVSQLILLPGTGSEALEHELTALSSEAEKLSAIKVPDFPTALQQVQKMLIPGTTVLISPACAGFQSHFLQNRSIQAWVQSLG
jgi:UDP-N-acetylmuramoylalanine-D-glutamate ligase